MVEPNKNMTYKLLDLIQKTGYQIMQRNGQRKFGPPPDWVGAPPPKGCEIFIGKLPRDIFEDELVPIFSKIGKIYEMRLMMDFSGSNRGYAFVTYTNRFDAGEAVKRLNGYQIRPGRNLGVVKSVDNCRLFVGGVPKNKTKEEIKQELSVHVNGIVDVILYSNCFDRKLNRGFAFVEFSSHHDAAMARRALVPGIRLWDQEVMVDWAEPEPDVDDGQMTKVKILYARNFQIKTTPETIKAVFEHAINFKIERIKKIYDYAFIHFYERSHAELALAKLQNVEIEGVNIEIKWAKPVDRELYRIQKKNKGNAKFNAGLDFKQTLLLYKQHLDKREYASSAKDEGIGSAHAGESPCNSPTETNPYCCGYKSSSDDYFMAPAKLEAMCKKYGWVPPMVQYQEIHRQMYVCKLELPYVVLPLLSTPIRIGPLVTRPHNTKQEAYLEASQQALQYIMSKIEHVQLSPPPLYQLLPQPPYVNQMYLQQPPMQPPPHPMWRTA